MCPFDHHCSPKSCPFEKNIRFIFIIVGHVVIMARFHDIVKCDNHCQCEFNMVVCVSTKEFLVRDGGSQGTCQFIPIQYQNLFQSNTNHKVLYIRPFVHLGFAPASEE